MIVPRWIPDSADRQTLTGLGPESSPYKLALFLDTSVPVRRAANVWFLLVIAYLTFTPAGRNQLLIPILAVSAGVGVSRMLVRVILRDPAPEALRLILLPAAAGLVPVILGLVFGTPGWSDVAVPLVAAPIAWFFIAHGADDWAVRRIPAAIAVGTILLSSMIFMLVTGVGDSFVKALYPRSFGVRDVGVTRVSVTGASSLIWSVPLLAASVFESNRRDIRLPYRHLLLAGLLFGVVGALLSGRQGVAGALLLTPILLFALAPAGFRYSRTLQAPPKAIALRLGAPIAVLVIALGVAAVVGVSPSRVPADVLDAVGLGQDSQNGRVRAGSGVRSRQAASFIAGWQESPIYGKGAGAVSPEFYTWRGYEIGDEFVSTARPWRAEMHYHLLLFESGLVGILAYIATIFTVLSVLRSRYRELPDARRLLIRAALVSATVVTFATAYNPLVRALGGQLPLYLPMIFVAASTIPARSMHRRR